MIHPGKVALISISLLLCGCEYPKADQCLRREIFQTCMHSLPAGPQSTQYNDWDEVVEACASTAYHQSLRVPNLIKPECST
jgi:hypothetical protein